MSDTLDIQELERFLRTMFTIQPENREKIELLNLGDNSIGGVIVSNSFNGLSSEDQQKKFLHELMKYRKLKNLKRGIYPAVLLYSPEEYRLANREELEGVLRTHDIYTFGASDIIVSVDPKYWTALTKKIDLSDAGDTEWEIQVAVRSEKNLHLYDHLMQHGFGHLHFNWFDCDGYYFNEVSQIQIAVSGITNIMLISFRAKYVAPWDLPEESS